ncbi:unnamed protein product [Amoebophrya sp. A25]|nr:unnamed protein product [Amoebophrya sp. A25]|eukprot:GSA25T00007942001.1
MSSSLLKKCGKIASVWCVSGASAHMLATNATDQGAGFLQQSLSKNKKPTTKNKKPTTKHKKTKDKKKQQKKKDGGFLFRGVSQAASSAVGVIRDTVVDTVVDGRDRWNDFTIAGSYADADKTCNTKMSERDCDDEKRSNGGKKCRWEPCDKDKTNYACIANRCKSHKYPKSYPRLQQCRLWERGPWTAPESPRKCEDMRTLPTPQDVQDCKDSPCCKVKTEADRRIPEQRNSKGQVTVWSEVRTDHFCVPDFGAGRR